MPRDLEYEENNIGYDYQYTENESGGIKCKNYYLCETILPKWWYDCKGKYLCTNCDIFDWKELEFRDCPENEECAVCIESNRQVKFPANCGHWFCCECSRDILFWDENRYHLSPEPYGCPPCPNGCENPIRGRQCDCYEYFGDDENPGVIQKWATEHPEEFEKYNDDTHESLELSETTPGSVFNSKKCPLCRKMYERN
jgi:hypothetical protein